jgi:hypothetical protein
MKTINLNKPFTDLDGKKQGELTIGQSLAQVLITQTKGDALKLFSWATTLHKNRPLTLDPSDLRTLRELIENSEVMYVALKAQILAAIDEAK